MNLPPPKKAAIQGGLNLVYLRLGDVLKLDGAEYAVDMVNDCRARCQPLKRQMKTVVMEGKERSMNCAVGKRDISISVKAEPGTVLRRLAGAELEQFLSGVSASSHRGTNNEATEEEKHMSKKSTTETKAAKAPRSYKGRSAAIHELFARKMKPENILAKIKETWPDTTPKVITDVTASKARGDAAKATKATTKAAAAAKPTATPPAKKATPASKAPPAPKAKSATPPAPKKKGPPAPKAATPPAPAPAAAPAEEPAPATEGEGFAQAAA